MRANARRVEDYFEESCSEPSVVKREAVDLHVVDYLIYTCCRWMKPRKIVEWGSLDVTPKKRMTPCDMKSRELGLKMGETKIQGLN